jgi:CheY-like chemotaxis protein
MPIVDGKTAILTLKKINPQVFIIAISGSNCINEENKFQIGDIELQAFLPKPFTVQDLLTTLQTLLQSQRLFEKCRFMSC